VVSARQLDEKHYQKLFTNFVGKYNKEYEHDQFFLRYNIFKANYDLIHQHNSKANASYTMALNQFADMTAAEFKAKMTGYKPIDRSYLRSQNQKHNLHAKYVAAGSSVDWRAKGAVTPVKNQGQCGSCWAFSTTGSTEGAVFLKTGVLTSLSEQQLVDCSTAQGNQGCNGGLMDQGFQYIISNKGLCTEASYPYTAADGSCNAANCQDVSPISSFTDVTPNDENALLQAVSHQPVSIAIEADQPAFQFYSTGVLDDASCGTTLDHGVLIVGYGTDAASSKDYWIVKNSWGASWGEAGYIRMVRNKNQCGLATDPSYPVV
jgi:cathepsin L